MQRAARHGERWLCRSTATYFGAVGTASSRPWPAARDVAQATLLLVFVCATAWALLPLPFLPLVVAQWLRAIRGATGERSVSLRGAVLFGLLAVAPGACAYVACVDAAREGIAALPRVLVASALVPVMLAPFVRAPLLFAAAAPREPVVGILRRSLWLAGAAPLRSLGLALLQAGATAAVLALAHELVVRGSSPLAIPAILALFPLVWTPVALLTSRATPGEVSPPRRATLGALAAFLAAGLVALVGVGALAVRDPLAMQVTRDGSGIQRVRGLQRSDHERGRLETAAFRIEGHRGRVLVHPRDAAPYEVSASYDASLAQIHASPRGAGSIDVRFDGPDWQMQLEVDTDGRRLDDGMLARTIARVGVLGTASLFGGIAAVIATLLVLARIASQARRASGAGYAHRLAGRLRAGERAALEAGALVGDQNVVELEGGSAMFRLPDRLVPIGVEQGLADALDGAPVIVSTDRPPSIVTHRSATSPWPATAQLVIGSPSAIESQALTRAAGPITVMVGAGLAITSLALMLICAG